MNLRLSFIFGRFSWRGVQPGAMLQSDAGLPLMVNWAVPANLFPGGRTQSVTVNLVPPAASISIAGRSSI
jgi:hypothetical protein